MNFFSEDIQTQERVSITNLLPRIGPEKAQEEIIAGLLARPRKISSKFFYNKRGSELYEEITRTKEYYPTRTELKILERMAPSLMRKYAGYDLVELGPGDPSKISVLLNAASDKGDGPITYVPLDISQPALEDAARILTGQFPTLHIEACALDFFTQFDQLRRTRPQLICFFGSTIGNFETESAIQFMQDIRSCMKPGDALLMGMDLVKEASVLHAAYNDAAGITAEFNRNILNSVNDILDSDFRAEAFDHLAFFNRERSRMEMHLEAQKDMLLRIPALHRPLSIRKGERIHTENSHKYRQEQIREMAELARLDLVKTYRDSRDWFALSEFRV